MTRNLSRSAAIALSLITLIAGSVAAQDASRDTSALNGSTATAAVVVPSVADSFIVAPATLYAPVAANRVVDRRAQTADAVLAHAMSSSGISRNPAMMIFGGAAIIVGSVIGGNGGAAIAITGGVVGLIGLWNYLR